MKLTPLLLASSLVFGAAACDSGETVADVQEPTTADADTTPESIADSPGAAESIVGTSWTLQRMGDQVPPEGAEHPIELSFGAGTFTGSDGCNSITGTLLMLDDSSNVALGDMAGTEMACEGEVGEFGIAYAGELMQASSLVVDGDTLTITTSSTELVYQAA